MSIAQDIKNKIYELMPLYFSHGEVVRSLIHSRINHSVKVENHISLIKSKKDIYPAIFEYKDGSILIINEYSIKAGMLTEEKTEDSNPYQKNN